MTVINVPAPTSPGPVAPQNSYSLCPHRPTILKEFVGQDRLKATIRTACLAAYKQNRAFPHSILTGEPGNGKTTLAQIIAAERGVTFIQTSADEINQSQSIQAMLGNLDQTGYSPTGEVTGTIRPTIVFIDEIHRLRRQSEELLYTALEDRIIEISQKSVLTGIAQYRRAWIPVFSLIGATNRPFELTPAFRDRMKLVLKIEAYSQMDIEIITQNCLERLNIGYNAEVLAAIAQRSRFVPRRAISLAETVRDQVIASNSQDATLEHCNLAFTGLGIDPLGLTLTDRDILRLLARARTPVGLKGLAAGLCEDPQALESAEPFLIRQGLISRTGRGRLITNEGLQHLRAHHSFPEQ